MVRYDQTRKHSYKTRKRAEKARKSYSKWGETSSVKKVKGRHRFFHAPYG